MVVETSGINLSDYKNIHVESYGRVKCFADGRIDTFTGITKYKKIYGLAKKMFKDAEFFEVEPHFFEMHHGVEDKGLVVDTKKLEIRILDNKNFDDAFKLFHKFRNNNLNYKVVKEAD